MADLHNASGNRAGGDQNRNENIAKGLFLDRASVLLGPIWHHLGCFSGLENCIIQGIDEGIDGEETNVQNKVIKIFDKMEESSKSLDWSIIEDILLRLERYQDIRDLREKIKTLEIRYGKIIFFNTNFAQQQQGTRQNVNLDEIEAKSNEATLIFLHKVASEICSYWTNFGNVAGWSTKEINADKGGVQKKAYKLLCEMRTKSKEPFKWINIREILKDLNKNQVIENLEKEIAILHERYGPQPFFNTDRSSITTEAIQETQKDSGSITMRPIQDTNSNEDYLDVESCYLAPPEVRGRPVVNPIKDKTHVYEEIPVKRKETAI